MQFAMTESCATNPALARKSHGLLLRALANVGQKPLGEALGKSETWVSRFKSDDSETFTLLLAAIGLKVVPAEHQCYEPAYIEHLRYFAQVGIAVDGQPGKPPPLSWEEET